MSRSLLVAFMLLGSSTFAHGENFTCQGTGRFQVIEHQTFELKWRDQTQKILMDGRDLKVLASIDKANSDGTHYFSIEVLEMKDHAVSGFRGAKGSLRDMVQYIDGESSIITCLPIK